MRQAIYVADGENTDEQKVTPGYVRDRMLEAAVTALSLTDWSAVPDEIAQRWQPAACAIIDVAELWTAQTLWPTPSADRVQRMIEALNWLSFVGPTDARVLMSKSWIAPTGTRPILGPRSLTRGFDMSLAQIEARFQYALRVIAGLLSEAEKAAA